jgi:hypothetical protein
MKKTFPLTNSRHKPARVLESIRRDIRKYVKRERRKPLPEGVDFWDFNCRVGKSSDEAGSVHVEELGKKIDVASENNWEVVYVEILAKPGYRRAKETDRDSDDLLDS